MYYTSYEKQSVTVIILLQFELIYVSVFIIYFPMEYGRFLIAPELHTAKNNNRSEIITHATAHDETGALSVYNYL